MKTKLNTTKIMLLGLLSVAGVASAQVVYDWQDSGQVNNWIEVNNYGPLSAQSIRPGQGVNGSDGISFPEDSVYAIGLQPGGAPNSALVAGDKIGLSFLTKNFADLSVEVPNRHGGVGFGFASADANGLTSSFGFAVRYDQGADKWGLRMVSSALGYNLEDGITIGSDILIGATEADFTSWTKMELSLSYDGTHFTPELTWENQSGTHSGGLSNFSFQDPDLAAGGVYAFFGPGDTSGGYFPYQNYDNIIVTGTQVPEPSSSLLVGLAGVAFILRRSRG